MSVVETRRKCNTISEKDTMPGNESKIDKPTWKRIINLYFTSFGDMYEARNCERTEQLAS